MPGILQMHVARAIAEVRKHVGAWRAAGERIALVPTMGNLHPGHFALVAAAGKHADKVAVSIFVNPLQFDRADDFESYPRTRDADLERLRESDTALVFTPDHQEMYPPGRGKGAHVNPGDLGAILCGACRPGHFSGVATVVVKLLNIFTPDVAVFGEKDYQQLVLIRGLVKRLNFGVRVVAVPTVRDADGLALSSRNALLSREQKDRAAALYRVLRETAAALRGAGKSTTLSRFAAAARRDLERAGLRPDYVEIRDARTLAPVTVRSDDGSCVILAAVRLGRVRLIDNIIINVDA